MKRAVVVGGGLVGLSVARELLQIGDSREIKIIEKESDVAVHQSGRNSGVIHSGIYYKPNSLKAKLCLEGRQKLVEYASHYGIPYQITGKLIVATRESELITLRQLLERGWAHGLNVKLLNSEQAKQYEPNVNCLSAIRVDETGVIDYTKLAQSLRDEILQLGGSIHFETKVTNITEIGSSVQLTTSKGVHSADLLINCSGLYSDVLSNMSGEQANSLRIIPFRGEYFDVVGESAKLVNGPVYPVPDPRFPFLGVHVTKSIDGLVHAGPNAVLALSREGYRWSNISIRETVDTVTSKAFLQLARQNLSIGCYEVLRSWSKKIFHRDVCRLFPEINIFDLKRSTQSGVRAQAVDASGSLVDDFRIEKSRNMIHILNAPSPAATSSLAIGRHVAEIAKKMI